MLQIEISENKIKKRTIIDKIGKKFFLGVTFLCALIIVIITLYIIKEGVSPFFEQYEVNGVYVSADLIDFLFGTSWADNYGAGYIVIDTILVVALSLVMALPISILSALFIARIAPNIVSKVLNTAIEMLAAIPSVIYGLFGMGVINSLVKNISSFFGYQSAGGLSMLSAAIVLAMMIVPTITMLSVTAIRAVKKEMILGSLALGASQSETNFKVVLTSAKSGIFSGIILGVGRALGEATAVSMVCGNAGSGPTFNIFSTTQTLTSRMLLGIHDSTGINYDIRFSLGILLMILIIVVNIILNMVKNRIGRVDGK